MKPTLKKEFFILAALKIAAIIALFVFLHSCQTLKNGTSKNVLKQTSCPKF